MNRITSFVKYSALFALGNICMLVVGAEFMDVYMDPFAEHFSLRSAILHNRIKPSEKAGANTWVIEDSDIGEFKRGKQVDLESIKQKYSRVPVGKPSLKKTIDLYWNEEDI